MAWLAINPNSSVNATLQEATFTQRRVHWVDNRSVDCPGAGCPLCADKHVPKERYEVPVLVDGTVYTWEFSQPVKVQLEALFPDAPARVGGSVIIRRFGTGQATRYLLEKEGQKSPQLPAQPITAPRGAQPTAPLGPAEHFLDDISAAQLERIASNLEALLALWPVLHPEVQRQNLALEGIWGRLDGIEGSLASINSVMVETNWAGKG